MATAVTEKPKSKQSAGDDLVAFLTKLKALEQGRPASCIEARSEAERIRIQLQSAVQEQHTATLGGGRSQRERAERQLQAAREQQAPAFDPASRRAWCLACLSHRDAALATLESTHPEFGELSEARRVGQVSMLEARRYVELDEARTRLQSFLQTCAVLAAEVESLCPGRVSTAVADLRATAKSLVGQGEYATVVDVLRAKLLAKLHEIEDAQQNAGWDKLNSLSLSL